MRQTLKLSVVRLSTLYLLLVMLGMPQLILAQTESSRSQQSIVPGQLLFELDEKQYRKYRKFKKNLSKEYFELAIGTDLNPDLTIARARMRGKGSFRTCDRKSFTIDLRGSGRASLLPQSQAEQYYLISMCLDKMYLRGQTFYRLWDSVDLFPFKVEMVELLINGKSRGLYMLLEKASDIMHRSNYPPLAILRRGFNPPHTFIEVNHTSTTNDLARLDYTYAFNGITALDPTQFVERIRRVLDLNQYIRHLAVASIFQNGDYVDELWFVQFPNGVKGIPPGYIYRVFKWDPDDVFRNCHYAGKFAHTDPWGMAYCVESELGKHILNQPEFYDQFVNEVDRLLRHELSVENFQSVLTETYTSLTKRFEEESLRNAMDQFKRNESNVVDLLQMQSDIDDEFREINRKYLQNRKTLLEKISVYRMAKKGGNH